MDPVARIRLSIMMFLQFFVWGSWAVTLGTYLSAVNFTGIQIGAAYSTTAWAAIVSPFVIGVIADRLFPAQYVFAILHLAGAGILYYASSVLDPAVFFFVLLAYALCYMPTLALVNSISFNQMSNPDRYFPGIRLLGTLGWIVAGIVVGRLQIEDTNIPLRIAAGASVLLGLYGFTLPHTPPKSRGEKLSFGKIIGADAIGLMKDRSFAVFVVSSLLICIPLAFYYGFANLFLNESGISNAAGKQTFGQVSEVLFLLVMPFLLLRLGVKKMLLIGMCAWFLRYFLFAYGENSPLELPITADQLVGTLAMVGMLYVGILLHGICFDFFFVTGQLYVDKKAPREIRSSAQGFIALITYGVGMVIGSNVSGYVVDLYAITEMVDGEMTVVGHDWNRIWLVPAIMAVVVTIGFALLFNEKKSIDTPTESEVGAH